VDAVPNLADVAPLLQWPYLPTLERLALALAIGIFVGMERQRRGKDAGVRTFAFAGLLGCLGGLEGGTLAVVSVLLVGLLVMLLSINAMRSDHGTELTTGASLLVVAYVGLLCGQGHTLTPAALGVLTAALLAWKEPLAGLSLGLTEQELRSAILLGILAFVVYPALPEGPIDPWHLIDLRAAWVTVILIAGIGFFNYILLKIYGQTAIELTGFLGGLVNSTVTVTALASRVQEAHELAGPAYRGVLLATIAMIIRNAVLLAILSPDALECAAPTLFAMLIVAGALMAFGRRGAGQQPQSTAPLPLKSPFSLLSTLKFGLLFLALNIVGTVAERLLGHFGYFGVSLAGGLVSSASSVASAGELARTGILSPNIAGTGAVIASLASALVDLPVVARVARERPLTRRTAVALGLIVAVGTLAAIAASLFPTRFQMSRAWIDQLARVSSNR
jgi:uncharacterized membrane protein (DUF4010 family)